MWTCSRAKWVTAFTSWPYLRLFSGLDRTDVLLLVVGTAAGVGAGVPLPVIGVLFGKMLDQFNQATCGAGTHTFNTDRFLSAVAQHVVHIVAVAAANFGLVWIYTSCWSALGERVVRRLRENYVRSLLSQDMAFFDLLPPGTIDTHLTADLLAVQNGTSEKVGILIASLAYFVTSYAVAFYLLPSLAAQLIALVPALLLVSLIGAHFGSRYSAKASEELGSATGLATEILSHLRVVQAFEALRPLCRVYHAYLEQTKSFGLRRALTTATMMGALFFMAYSANALAFHSGARMVTSRMGDPNANPSETVGAVYTVIFLLLDASFVVGQIAPYLQAFSAAGGAGARLAEIVQTEPSMQAQQQSGRTLDDELLGFRMENVDFAYPARPDAPVLRDTSWTIAPGERVGICGVSGSGKSTLAALLHRFYDPDRGSITLHDGTPLTDVHLPWFRAQLGYVGQDASLAHCTILENVAHGLVGSTRHAHLRDALRYLSRRALEGPLPSDWLATAPPAFQAGLQEVVTLVTNATQAAHAHTFVQTLPTGYLTNVGHAAHTLSGGQKQRIALARAIVKQPRVLILDEATAALDSQSEMAVQAALDAMTEARTMIVIAHRLATIKHYDRIIVMVQGAVAEQGTHAELLALNGHYAHLARSQGSDADASPAPSAGSGDVPQQELPTLSDSSLHKDAPAEETAAELVPLLSHSQALRRLGAWTAPTWPFWVVGLGACTLIGGAYSGEAVLFGHVVQALNPCQAPSRITSQADLFALFFFVLALVELGAYFVSGAALGYVAESLLLRIRKRIVEVLAAQRLQWYETRHVTPSTLIANYVADTSNLGGLTGTVLGTIASILVNLVAGVVLAHIVAWRIAVVILATVPILLLSGYLRLKILAEFQQRHESVYAQSTEIAVNAVKTIQTVHALGREDEILELFHHALDAPYRESLRHIVIGNVFLACSLSISYFIYAFAYWWGSRNVAEGRYSQVAFFTVLPALLFSAQTSGQLLAFGPDVSKAAVSAVNLFSLLEHTTGPDEGASAPKADIEAPASALAHATHPLPVSFEDVSFQYAQRETPALLHVQFHVAAAHFVALIGESGSGKSTCLSLIENLYAPTSGSVRVGGYETTAVPTADLRAGMAIVPQDPMLFHGTIAMNIALGLHDPLSASTADVDPRIVQACREAHIHEDIMAMPLGYSTDVGPSGDHLSGGQRQRLAIARALVRRPRLLLLDEPTSAMDATSEQAFQDTLDTLMASRSCTLITVAHRMRTIRKADEILLFSHGEILARGNHTELMQSCEAYQTTVAHQSMG